MELVEFHFVNKAYQSGQQSNPVLQNINISISEGSFVVVLGPSGAGKSTFLNLIGGLDLPDSGGIYVDGQDITELNRDALADFRAAKVGYIFQNYNLVPTLTVLENVALMEDIVPDCQDASKMLDMVGLGDKPDQFPARLSGGEQQRVAIARALVKNPRILLCDEPTGALDAVTGGKIMALLQKLARQRNMTVVAVTHNPKIARMADRVVEIRQGGIASDRMIPAPLNAEEIDW